MTRRDPNKVPCPRVERNASDQIIHNIGVHGGLAVAAAGWPGPNRWPADWPDVDMLSYDELEAIMRGHDVVIPDQ